MLLGIDMSLVGTPSIGVKLRDTKGLKQSFELQENVVLTPSEHIRQHLPRVVINGVPKPAWIGFASHRTPHFIQFGTQPTTHLELIGTPDFHLHLLRIQNRQHASIHRLELRFFFLSSLMTVVGPTWSTRAVSRMPLAFIAMSMICCLTSAE